MNSTYEDIVGKKYGRLTVKEVLDHHHILCECECGTVKSYLIHNVIYGRSKSCGCLSTESRKNRLIDLTGQTYGELTVISYAGHKNGRTAWNCLCSCGNQCIVTAHDLRSGHTKSCGCLKKGRGIINLQGYRSGYLVAIRPTEKRTSKGSVIWECECMNCGKKIELSEDAIKHGSYISCGCMRLANGKRLHSSMHFYEGTCLEYLQRRVRSDNTTGHTGVYVHGKNYRATITFMGKKYNLGTYQRMEEAVSVREEAEEKLFQTFIKSYTAWLEKSCEERESNQFVFEVERKKDQFIIYTNVDRKEKGYGKESIQRIAMG